MSAAIQITLDDLLKLGAKPKFAERHLKGINAALIDIKADTPVIAACFLAQIYHESGMLMYSRELASGKAYEGRKDLGNTQRGDGQRFAGRGLIQLTGRVNYQAFSKAIGEDFVANPVLVEQDPWAARSAAWYWNTRKLNQYCSDEKFVTLTKRINGGTRGLEHRQQMYAKAKRLLAGRVAVAAPGGHAPVVVDESGPVAVADARVHELWRFPDGSIVQPVPDGEAVHLSPGQVAQLIGQGWVQVDKTPGTEPNPWRDIADGNGDEDEGIVRRIQSAVGVAADGDWGPNTTKAVQLAQKRLGLPVTGVVDRATADALDLI